MSIAKRALSRLAVVFRFSVAPFFFFFGHTFVARGVLVPQPGIKPGPLPWKHVALTTGPPGKSPQLLFNAF